MYDEIFENAVRCYCTTSIIASVNPYIALNTVRSFIKVLRYTDLVSVMELNNLVNLAEKELISNADNGRI